MPAAKIAGDRSKDTELNQQLHVLEQTLKGMKSILGYNHTPWQRVRQ